MNEYQVCVQKRGEEDLACMQRARDYLSICPSKWVSDWKSQSEEGVNLTIGALELPLCREALKLLLSL